MDPSNDHDNWKTVGELIRLIKKPVALYTSQIVKTWHVKLCSRLPPGKCTNPAVCQTKKNPSYLCLSCQRWYDELVKSHRNKDKREIKWRENCDTSKWPFDPWEVAKFFMPILKNNKKSINDAESTDLSCLLNVLEWTKNEVFAPGRRVDLNLVRRLRSEVRNPWAHSPNHELTEAILNDAFDIANKLFSDLEKVFSFPEVKQCIEDIKVLQANGLSNVEYIELEILNLQLIERGVKSCIPEKPQTFIGRDTEVNQIISLLVENGWGIVSIVGGPGFGKSSLAEEVSHHLSNNHDIVVIFSYLSNASTVPEVMQRLCRDVGVYPGEDPESSLMLLVKNIENKIVLVMDNIEQLLESNTKSEFTELLLTLRKNSRQYIQILTTTRIELSIHGKATVNVPIGELDEKSSVELLRECCPNEKVEDRYLSELAELCGFVPLALCIAGTLIPVLDDPLELIQWIKEKPMEALENSSVSDHCVRQAIDFSFQKLEDEEKKAFVRLSVFNGNFQKKSAQEVIERNGIKTLIFLSKLVNRSLIQRSNINRFVIHSLTRRFLTDHDQFQDEKTMAQGLMVRHFLEMCHGLTMDSYSRNRFTGARKALKKDAHNVEETLKICSHPTNPNSKIREFLGNSKIYESSSRFFYDFGWDLLSQTLLKDFFEFCIKLAESRNEPAIEITFQCLVADQDGRKYGWDSTQYKDRIKTIMEMFHANEVTLKEDRFLFSFCYYSLARYEADQTTTDLPVYDLASLPVNKASSPIGEVAEALILRERGQLKKKHANEYHKDKNKYEEYMDCAKLLHKKALLLAKDLLGDHELTCTLHKQLGDLLFNWRKNEEARACYHDAITLRKQLELDSNEQFVFLLKNYGACLSFVGCFEESVKQLEEARDIADKLAEKHTPCRAKVYYQLAKVYCHWKPDCQEAAGYARTGMEMQGLLDSREEKTLQEIIKRAAENVDYEA